MVNPLEDLVRAMNGISANYGISKIDINNRGINPHTSEWVWVVCILFDQYNDELIWMKLERMNGHANSDVMLCSLMDVPLVRLACNPVDVLVAMSSYAFG